MFVELFLIVVEDSEYADFLNKETNILISNRNFANDNNLSVSINLDKQTNQIRIKKYVTSKNEHYNSEQLKFLRFLEQVFVISFGLYIPLSILLSISQ